MAKWTKNVDRYLCNLDTVAFIRIEGEEVRAAWPNGNYTILYEGEDAEAYLSKITEDLGIKED